MITPFLRLWVMRFMFVASLLAASLHGEPARAADDVLIGVLQPLSGREASRGIAAHRGAVLAAEMINAAGGIKALGGARIKLVAADVPTPNSAALTLQRLLSHNRVSALIGDLAASIPYAASEVIERAGVPFVTFTAADQEGHGRANLFHILPSVAVLGEAQFSAARQIAIAAGEPLKRISILYEDTPYRAAQAAGVRRSATAAGVEIVFDESYPQGMTDVLPLVHKLRASQAQAVFALSHLKESILLLRALRQQRMAIPVIGGADGYMTPEFKQALGELTEGVLAIAASNGELVPELAEKYERKYGTHITQEAIVNAAALGAVVEAIQRAGSAEPRKVRGALASLEICTGFARGVAGGCIKFDAQGQNTSASPLVVQWRGRAPLVVYPPAVAKQAPNWPSKGVN